MSTDDRLTMALYQQEQADKRKAEQRETQEPAPLRALVEKWLNETQWRGADERYWRRQCADELDAALSASAVSAQTPQDWQEIIADLEKAERERLAQAYKLPYSEKGILVSNAYLRALADVRTTLLPAAVSAPTPQEHKYWCAARPLTRLPAGPCNCGAVSAPGPRQEEP